MNRITVIPHRNPRRRSQLEQDLRDAEQLKEQYKHNALLHRVHTIHCEYIQKQLTARTVFVENRREHLQKMWQRKREFDALNRRDKDEHTHS